MDQVYTIESCKLNGFEVIRISDIYWNEHSNEFLKNKESFDKEMIEFLKNVEDIHAKIESRYKIVVQTPSMKVKDRHTFHTFSKKNIISFQSLGYSIRDDIRDDIGNRSMNIYLIQKPNIPKPVVPIKPRMDENTKIFLEDIKKSMFQKIENMWDITIKEYFEI